MAFPPLTFKFGSHVMMLELLRPALEPYPVSFTTSLMLLSSLAVENDSPRATYLARIRTWDNMPHATVA